MCIRDSSVGDIVSLSEKGKQQDRVRFALDNLANREDCDWLELDSSKFLGTYKSIPERDQLDSDINENLIIELYSK